VAASTGNRRVRTSPWLETLLFNALRDAYRRGRWRGDDTVCVFGEDVGEYGGSYKVTKDLYEENTASGGVLDTPNRDNSFTAWPSRRHDRLRAGSMEA